MENNSLRRLPRNIWAVTATSFLTDISSEMIFNLIPLFLANVLGVGTAVIGLIDGVAETTASLTKVYAGSLSDKLGQRKWPAVAGYALSTIAKPFLYFANAWGWVFGVRFADRMGKGIRTAPRDALVADSIDEKQRGLAFGVHRAGDTAGAFTGLGLAALIVWLTQSGAAELTRQAFQIAVLASILPAVLAVLVLAFGANDVPGSGTKRSSSLPSFEGLDRRFKLFLFVVLLFTLGNSSDSFIVLLGQKRGLDVLQIMLMVMTVQPDLRLPRLAARLALGPHRPTAADHRRMDCVRAGLPRPGAVTGRLARLVIVRVIWYLLRRHRRCGPGPGRRPRP